VAIIKLTCVRVTAMDSMKIIRKICSAITIYDVYSTSKLYNIFSINVLVDLKNLPFELDLIYYFDIHIPYFGIIE